MNDFKQRLSALTARVEAGIDALLPSSEVRPARLHEAMRYSVQAGGKRLRPVLALTAAELVGADLDPLPAAVALECVHTYSLIHDDLPCMDNDDLRRGRPTAHKAYDEATALLAGDALLTHAFSLLSRHYGAQPATSVAMIQELSRAAGSEELIGGQMEDLLAEKNRNPSAEQLTFIHLNKTAAMLRASLVLGALCRSDREAGAVERFSVLGRELGLTFQIVDDLLDATADSATLGKTAGKDAKADKTTFVKLYGLEGARAHAAKHTEAALVALDDLPGNTAFLRELVNAMLVRQS